MILADSEILNEMKIGSIVISPFNKENLGSNSYDLTLSNKIGRYKWSIMDCKNKRLDEEPNIMTISETGLVLQPGLLYLGCTNEYTETHNHVPIIDGKSAVGRIGLFVHVTAGFGDVGFKGNWTLEMIATMPTRIYPNMKICQIHYQEVLGKVNNKYYEKENRSYDNSKNKTPIFSKIYKQFK